MSNFSKRVNTPEKRAKYNDYQREYAKRRRKTDEEFRRKRNDEHIAWMRKKIDSDPEFKRKRAMDAKKRYQKNKRDNCHTSTS